MMDYAFDGLLERAKKKKTIKKIPTAPKIKIDVIKEIFKKEPAIMNAVQIHEMFRLIDGLKKTREGEFRKGVCLRVWFKGEEIAINLDKLKEYSDILEKFINYTKFYLSSKE